MKYPILKNHENNFNNLIGMVEIQNNHKDEMLRGLNKGYLIIEPAYLVDKNGNKTLISFGLVIKHE